MPCSAQLQRSAPKVLDAKTPVPRYRKTPRLKDCLDNALKHDSELHLIQPIWGLRPILCPKMFPKILPRRTSYLPKIKLKLTLTLFRIFDTDLYTKVDTKSPERQDFCPKILNNNLKDRPYNAIESASKLCLFQLNMRFDARITPERYVKLPSTRSQEKF